MRGTPAGGKIIENIMENFIHYAKEEREYDDAIFAVRFISSSYVGDWILLYDEDKEQ